ncbi:MAG TPA: DUF86 domain-containing protein [Anaerolineales bacterium]|nr:DUF86 domain-containing protein [Anaerolineales bacterium]
MSRNPRLYLEDIQQSCAKVLRFTAGLSFEQFKQDDRTYDAVLRNLEIIGEAAKNVPDEIRQRFSFVEWRKISGFRDIAAHQYFSISDSIAWDIIQNKIPELSAQISQILSELLA